MRNIFMIGVITIFVLLSFRSIMRITVEGKVMDETGKPLPRVTVIEKGTSNGTTTDVSGKFVLSVLNEQAKIIITALGFEATEMAVKDQGVLQVSLIRSKQKPEEAVVSALPYNPAPIASMNGRGFLQKTRMDASSYPGYISSSSGVSVRREHDRDPEHKKDSWRHNNNYNTEDYDAIVENRFLTVKDNALSTFSIDVDGASYSNIRRYLQNGQLPPAGSVRLEEMINYFHYDYPQPANGDPFSVNTESADCPWNSKHRLVLVGLQGKKIPAGNLPASNLVFLIDVSGSMMPENRLPLVKASMKLLVDQLRDKDKVSIVVYAGSAGLVLPTASGTEKIKIKEAIDNLEAGGSTAGGQGIKLAYQIAKQHFLKEGNNRVILCTDGDFNVGVSSDAELENIIEEERKSGVFLTVLGYGMGNYKDNKMQKLANKGNGNHAYIDGIGEAKKVLISEFGGTLFTIAKDVKLQVEFNPAKVQAYRLIGYENRLLNKEDFNNDQKDAGDMGSGHTVTALYEVIPVGVKSEFIDSVDRLKYQNNSNPAVRHHTSDELMTIKLRYKSPDGDLSKLIEHPVADKQLMLTNASINFRFASAVAEFGMLLRNSSFKQNASYDHSWQLAKGALGSDEEGYRSEFINLVKNVQSIVMNQKGTGGKETGRESIGSHR
ncbi:MAG: von Willebrand factor type A domain-containing protein [Chitinophagaceae bacterium]